MQDYAQALNTYKCRVSCGGVFNMLQVLSIPFIFTIIYGVCVQLAHFSTGDWQHASIAHVIIIIKSEVSTFPIVIIFFRCCVPKIFVTSYSVTYCICVKYCTVNDECKYSDTFWLADRTRLYSTPSSCHHCANLSEGIGLIKCLSDIFCRVCKLKLNLSRYALYNMWAVCFQFTIP